MKKAWALALAVMAVAAAASMASAVSTRRFTIDRAEAFAEGQMEGTAVHSDGTVTVGAQVRRLEVPDAAVAYSMARAKDGTVYIGTGHGGVVFRLRGDSLAPFAQTDQLLVASLAVGPNGTLYAGTLPEGRIYAIDAKGEAKELARPEGAEHVWALAWDDRRRRLFAATGPEGKVFAIDPQGRAEVFYDSPSGHVMALALDRDGTLYAGTSDDALVLRLLGPGRAEVVGDFPGNEVTAIDVRDGVVAVAANEFTDPPRIPSGARKPTGPQVTPPPRPKPGTGRLFRVGSDGRAERLLENKEGHFAAVQLAADGAIYAGTGDGGRILRATVDRRSATWIDVDERQVLALDVAGESPLFLTGDGAAVYRIVPGTPQKALWTSKVLDADFPSRWGELTWRASGSLELATRSGNTAEPDDTWSAWSSFAGKPGPVRSPAARYLQVRARFAQTGATLRAVQVFYLPQNQRPVVHSVGPEGKSEAAGSEAIPSPSKTHTLTWKVDNADGDALRYRLRFRREDQTVWRDLLTEDQVHTATKYAWDTSGVPDGWYVVEVRASDELANPEPLALDSRAMSDPFLVDNHPPRIEGLRQRGRTVTGRAVDSVGHIAKLEYAINGRRFEPFFPVDHLLDTRVEEFALELPAHLPAGSHIVAVRATDAGGNTATSEVTVELR
jgi:outer membrane protein assembly factor BamB